MAKGKGGSMLSGLTRTNPPGDSGAKPGSGRVDSDPTRSSVGATHSIGGRCA